MQEYGWLARNTDPWCSVRGDLWEQNHLAWGLAQGTAFGGLALGLRAEAAL